MDTGTKIVVGVASAAVVGAVIWQRRRVMRAATTVVSTEVKVAKAAAAAATALPVAASRGAIEVAEKIVEKIKDLPYFRRKPSARLMAAIGAACALYKVPPDVAAAVIYNESGFKETDNFRKEPGSYARWQKAGTKMSDGRKWTDVYSVDDWGSYGPTQTMIFNVVDNPGGLKPGQKITEMTVEQAVDLGVRLLGQLYQKYGNWYEAVYHYNGSGSKAMSVYVIHIAQNLKELGSKLVDDLVGPKTIDTVKRNLEKQSDRKDYASLKATLEKLTGGSLAGLCATAGPCWTPDDFEYPGPDW